MRADGILRVTVALRDRLRSALTRSGVPGTVFVGPLDDADASGAALILFLYRIVPNPSLRNCEHRVATQGQPPVQVFQHSLALDLYFLVTVGTVPSASEEILLRALGFVIEELQREPDLTGTGLSHETVRVTLEPLSTDDASRIWALFPTANYRTSIAYLATPLWIDPLVEAPRAPLVSQDQARFGQRGAAP